MVARADTGRQAGEHDGSADVLADGIEPSAAELAAIEDEWPVIAAEVALVDAEAGFLAAGSDVGGFAWRRLRRANRHLVAAWLWYATRRPAMDDGEVA